MKIGILQTGYSAENLRERHGDFPDMMRRLLGGHNFTFETYPVADGSLPQSIYDCSGWLVTGSSHSAYENAAWIARLELFLRRAFSAAVPIVGICFGHQILAQALGGRVEKSKHGWCIGPTMYEFTDGSSVVMHAWHQDQVTTLPEEACRIARSAFCENAALVYGLRALTYQAHPEFTTNFVRDLVDLRRSSLPREVVRGAEQSLVETRPSTCIGEQIANFFNHRNIHGKQP